MIEDKAYIDYQEMTGRVEKNMTKLAAKASDANVLASLSDLEIIKRKLDRAFTGLQSGALSTISSRCERRSENLMADLNEMKASTHMNVTNWPKVRIDVRTDWHSTSM